MAFRIDERFVVRAPAGAVWAYLIDPRRVVTCLPGAELTEVVDDRNFLGTVKVKVGPVTVGYKGKIHLSEVDEAARKVKLVGEGRESAGAGSAKMAMESLVTTLQGGETEVVVHADVDVVGRAVQLGRGMMEQVSAQLFKQFAACVRRTLEAEAAAAAPAAGSATAEAAAQAAGTAPPTPSATGSSGTSGATLTHRAEPIRALPLLFRALVAAVGAFLRRLLGQGAPPRR
jgi:carbon monoxide dehydrogenase subunit G